jgi:hypothetical protein
MKKFRSPTVYEMVDAYQRVTAAGLQNVRMGNTGVFLRGTADRLYLLANVDKQAW